LGREERMDKSSDTESLKESFDALLYDLKAMLLMVPPFVARCLICILSYPLRASGLLIFLAWFFVTLYLVSHTADHSSTHTTDDDTMSNSIDLFSYRVHSKKEYYHKFPGLIYNDYYTTNSAYDANSDAIIKTSSHFSEVTTPKYFKLKHLLYRWNPDDTDSRRWQKSMAHPLSNQDPIRRFDYSKPTERAIALQYRNAEIPFIVYNVDELDNAVKTGFKTSNLLKNFGSEKRQVERSIDNHFMYYR
jgi:hypothetical protein